MADNSNFLRRFIDWILKWFRPKPQQRVDLKGGSIEPSETRGAPYPPAPPSDRIPNVEEEVIPVPDGPRVGDMKPANPSFELVEVPIEQNGHEGEANDGEGALQQWHRLDLLGFSQ